MKILISHNRVAELNAKEVFEIFGNLLNGDIRSVTVDGVELMSPMTVEVRRSEPSEEREI